jgi:hypothetical protein
MAKLKNNTMENNKSVTTIEWLEEITYYKKDFNLAEVFKQAKEIEKQQIIDAFNEGQALNVRGILIKGEQYYKETFSN